MSDSRRKILIVYTHYPHYREGVFTQLLDDAALHTTICVDRQGIDATIKNSSASNSFNQNKSYQFGPFIWQKGVLAIINRNSFDVIIFLGNPYILTYWIGLLLCKIKKTKTILWTHGWLTHKKNIKERVRNLFYSMSDSLILYGDRARSIGLKHGFQKERLRVVYNSLDVASQEYSFEQHDSFSNLGSDYFLICGRLVESLRCDEAIRALSTLNSNLKLVIIGDGPCKDRLQTLAIQLNVKAEFKGAVYDEAILAPLFMGAIAVVSPGKAGLLVMHSLAYGTPVITHGNFDNQMPEVEALEADITGFFYQEKEITDLARSMLKAQQCHNDVTFRLRCRETGRAQIEKIYNPTNQKNLIKEAVEALLI